MSAQTVRQVHEVYWSCDAKGVCTKKQFQEDTTYYQTYGGGPEGGFFVKEGIDENGDICIVGIWSVHRTWHQPFKVRKTSWKDATYSEDAIYSPGDERYIANNLVLEKPKKAYKPRAKKVKNSCEECGQGENNNMKCSGKEDQDVSFVCDGCVKKDKPAPHAFSSAYCTLLD
jgi:hypothetical protein